MRRRAAGAAAVVALLLGCFERGEAQAAPTSGRVALTVTVHAGGTAFTRFQNVTLESAGSPETSYPAAIASSPAASLGADLTLWFRPWLGARVDFVYGPSNFELRLAEDDRVEVLGDEADYRSLDYSDLSLFSLAGAVVLALPIKSAHVAPYALIGGGAALLLADDRGAAGLDEAFDGGSAAISPSAVAGIGVKIPLTAGRVSLSFELVDRITETPIAANDDRVLLDTDDIRVINRLHPGELERDARYTHAVGIAAGLTFATGRESPADVVGRQ